jgi:tetratricopeptide (TPR) repeat protein
MEGNMMRPALKILAIWLILGFFAAAPGLAQEKDRVYKLMIESYDLMAAGKLNEAREIYSKVLKVDPGNPLALNNLGAIMFKEGKTKEALDYFNQALAKAKGYKVRVNPVCDVGGSCLAFKPSDPVYANQDLLPLIKDNIKVVKAAVAAGKSQK